MASLPELEARIAALEDRKIAVADLPVQHLIKKIEMLGLDQSALQDLPLGGAFGHYGDVLSTTPPGGPTAGTPFSVATGGVYLCLFTNTAYGAAAGGIQITHYIDGAQAAVASIFANSPSFHLALGTRAALRSLTAGQHYWFMQSGANTITDNNDRHTLFAVRVG
jgi:hypothetical protein